MPSVYSQALQAAETAFDDGSNSGAAASALLAAFDTILITTAVLTTADVALPIAHGLGAAPDYVLLTLTPGGASEAEGMGWTASATTLTLSKVDTQAQQTASVFAAVLA